jgi:hypothetical protein
METMVHILDPFDSMKEKHIWDGSMEQTPPIGSSVDIWSLTRYSRRKRNMGWERYKWIVKDMHFDFMWTSMTTTLVQRCWITLEPKEYK